ncbi:hypothetical protein ACFLYY_00425 [Patescibacteria group bacterium]
MKKNNFKKLNGFTVIEILIATSIMIVMSAVVFLNYDAGGQQLALHRSASKLSQDLRLAQEMAVSSSFSDKTEGDFPDGGYGIWIDRINNSEKYILYGDKNTNYQYDDGVDYEIKEIKFERGIFISKIDSSIGEKNSASVNFFPPIPETYIKTGDPTEPDLIVITLSLKNDLSQTRIVYINKAGLINVVEGEFDQCDNNGECDDGNVCTLDTCENPGDSGSICRNEATGEGTDCGNCGLCQSGTCESSCQGSDVSCGCVGSVCQNCITLFGVECGDSLCGCEYYEVPSGSCVNGDCTCDCVPDPVNCGEPISTPTVTNGIGASNITENTATLNGEVTDTGGENPVILIYWGNNDGGTNPGDWDDSVNLGTKGLGIFSTDIDSLLSETTYYYRLYGSNSAGGSWANNATSFVTSVAISTPTVTNGIGASNITENTATLNGEVTDTGGENPVILIYWGNNDGGTNPGDWDDSVNLGTKGLGIFSTDIDSLLSETTYYYRLYGSNSAGGSWANNATSFVTSAEPCLGDGQGCGSGLSDTKTLRPNATGTECNISYQLGSACPNHYLNVDEIISDGDLTYNRSSDVNYQRDLYNIDDVTLSGTINSVTAYARCKRNGWSVNQDSLKLAIETNGIAYESLGIQPTTIYYNYSNTWAINPNTGSIWTWDEINNLQAGVSIRRPYSSQSSYYTYCTQVWVEVDYIVPGQEGECCGWCGIDGDGDGSYYISENGLCVAASLEMDCEASNANIYQMVNVIKDADTDGYSAGSSAVQCVGTPTTISGRTYYKDSVGSYTWLGSAALGVDCCDIDGESHPGATYHPDTSACNSWDWDCSGTTEKQASSCDGEDGSYNCTGGPYRCQKSTDCSSSWNTGWYESCSREDISERNCGSNWYTYNCYGYNPCYSDDLGGCQNIGYLWQCDDDNAMECACK